MNVKILIKSKCFTRIFLTVNQMLTENDKRKRTYFKKHLNVL